MATARTADAWQQSGGHSDRPYRGSRALREEGAGYRDRGGRPAAPPRSRADRYHPDGDYRRPARPAGSRPPGARPAAARPAEARAAGARGSTASAAEAHGNGVRGSVAALGIFLLTLAGAGVDSFVGVGLGLITLMTLVVSTTIAGLVVRRRDLLTVVIAPPLVFIGVAALNIALAPSATFNLPTIATLLIRGFPTMAMGTGVAFVLALVRLIARR